MRVSAAVDRESWRNLEENYTREHLEDSKDRAINVCLLSRRSGFDPRPVRVGFFVDVVELGKAIL